MASFLARILPSLRRGPGKILRLFSVLLVVATALGCGESVAELDLYLPFGVFFSVNATPTEIAPGEEMSIVLRLENTNDAVFVGLLDSFDYSAAAIERCYAKVLHRVNL